MSTTKSRSKRIRRNKSEQKSKNAKRQKVQSANQHATQQEVVILKPELNNQLGTETHVVAYDENLLERARTQWQFGDWESLAKLSRDTLQHHPDRAKLALLAAAGHLQTGNSGAAKQFIRLAQDWGCSKKLVSQILVAGVHNSLGRAAVVSGQEPRALKHFESSIAIGTPGSELLLLTQARTGKQIAQLGLPVKELALLAIPSMCSSSSTESASIATIARQCLASDDVHDAIDSIVETKKLSPRDLIFLYIELAEQFSGRKDNLTALHYLETARDQTNVDDETLQSLLVRKFIELGKVDLATDMAVKICLEKGGYLQINEQDKAVIQSVYDKSRNVARASSEHGHDLLLSYLQDHLQQIKTTATDRKLVLIEIGTTRENIQGQGSTRKIAEYCHRHGVHFITVDMDPHNTRIATELFNKLGVPFQAITMKGEDYLRDYSGSFDFIFLDAYDFDHGHHSELRQSRYKKFLGNSIDDAICHQMHLDCAQSVLIKLTSNGVVCVDDTWLVDGKWTAKGTLAMPYLLKHGFKLLEARNRAALLTRAIPEADLV